jgi:hypothetical protein
MPGGLEVFRESDGEIYRSKTGLRADDTVSPYRRPAAVESGGAMAVDDPDREPGHPGREPEDPDR